MKAIALKEYINYCLLWNATRINETSDYCTNWYKELLWFVKSPYSATEIIGKTPKQPSEDSKSGVEEYKETDFLNYYSENKNIKSQIISSNQQNNAGVENRLNKSQMIIEDSILNEFLQADHNFDFNEDE